MKPKFIKDESEIPEGAVRVHFYDPKNVLMPRGSMKKESIGPYIHERLKGSFEFWTDPKYGDNPSVSDLITFMYTNLIGEVDQAWVAFVKDITSGLTKSNELLLKMSIMAVIEPQYGTESVEWFLDIILTYPELFVQAVYFIDKYDRTSKEYKYFTSLHGNFIKNSEEYKKMFEKTHDETSTIFKMFQEKLFLKK
ncbi:MAG: hypothetical protein V3W20_14045 [Candidatus Neomarinimicrobiota bacterium]